MLIPLVVTILMVVFVIDVITQPFVRIVEQFLANTDIFQKHATIIRIVLQLSSLVCLFVITILLGFLARIVVFKSLLTVHEYILHRIPIISTIYKATQQVMKTLFSSSSTSFKQVVMVPFPTKDSFCIGFISNKAPSICTSTKKDFSSFVTVFVPTTPNPTTGFLMIYKESEITPINMKVEDALKYIISCGLINSDEIMPNITNKIIP